MMTEQRHSHWGMSSAHRYLACPGSVAAGAHFKSEDSEYAAEGTRAHLLAATTLENPGMSVLAAKEKFHPSLSLLPDTILAVRQYVRHVRQLVVAEKDAVLYVEVKFKLATPEIPEIDGLVYGTADACIYYPRTRKLIIVDYKNGVGVKVLVENNAQLKGYGLGAVFELGVAVDQVEMHVVQPRVKDGSPAISKASCTAADLFEFREDLIEGIRATLAPNAPRVPSDPAAEHGHCHFCSLDGQCPERAASIGQALAVAQVRTGEPDDQAVRHPPNGGYNFEPPETLTDEQLAAVMNAAPAIRQFLKAGEGALKARLLVGKARGLGQKLVAAVPRREWKADVGQKDLEGFLRDAGIPKSEHRKIEMWSPAEVDKLIDEYVDDQERRLSLKSSIAVALVAKESKGLTLAPAKDRRPEVAVGASITQGLGALSAPPPLSTKD